MALYRVTSGDSHTVEASSDEEAEAIVAVALGYMHESDYTWQGFNFSEESLATVEEDETLSFTEKIAD